MAPARTFLDSSNTSPGEPGSFSPSNVHKSAFSPRPCILTMVKSQLPKLPPTCRSSHCSFTSCSNASGLLYFYLLYNFTLHESMAKPSVSAVNSTELMPASDASFWVQVYLSIFNKNLNFLIHKFNIFYFIACL